jgi:integrase/recombinase XerD
MTFRESIDLFLGEMRSQGRITSDGSESAYRKTLEVHADDVDNRDPVNTGRDDVKKTLRRWDHPNTQANRRAILVSFYRWMVREGMRPYNPAEQTRPPRKQEPQVYRMTMAETRAFLNAASTPRERRAVFLGVCIGARNAEIRGLQGRHFDRPDWVWISEDIAKRHKQRWVPVIPDLEPVVAEIQEHVAPDDYVLPMEVPYNLQPGRPPKVIPTEPSSHQTLWRIVARVGKRAGIAARIHPHLMRHAFGDHIARYAGMRNAQYLLGHADVGTTEAYTGTPTLDELAAAIRGFSFGAVGSPEPTVEYLQRYRHGDSNPGSRPPGNLSGVLADLFRSPVLREAAQRMVLPGGNK